MKFKELKLKNKNELTRLIEAAEEKLRVMRFKVAQRQLKKVHEVGMVKKEIARLKTLTAKNYEINDN